MGSRVPTVALATVDPDFAKEQLDLMLQQYFLHPTGQIPAYEWNFSDVNPPVHAWATIFLYRTEQALNGEGDIEFLKRSFSNWRGPIWLPVNIVLIRALLSFYLYYGDNFKIECPTGPGKLMNLFEVARDLSARLERIFLRDKSGRRPVYGGTEKFQTDPHWKDLILFFEYFHGDDGAGLGASHQTGWTGLVAKLIELFRRLDEDQFLNIGKAGAFANAETGMPSSIAAD